MKIQIISLFTLCSIGLFCCNNENKSQSKEKSKGGLGKEKQCNDIEKESQVKIKHTANSTKKEKKYIPPQVIFDPSYIDPMPRDPSLGIGSSIDPPFEGGELILEKPMEEEVFTVVEVNPEFKGGVNEMMKFLREHIIYPEDAKEIGIEGKVLIQFIVHKDGQLSDFKIIKKVYPSVDREAIRVGQKMPNWSPGKNNGNIVSVRVVIPIIFKLS